MTEMSSARSLLDRFPGLRRLETVARGRVPYVPQATGSDCGAACLTMVLSYHGKRMLLESVRTAVGAGRDGIDALAVVRAAREFGLRTQSLSIEPEDLKHLPQGAILHWGFNHFVVFEKVTRRGVRIVDPGCGRRHIVANEFYRGFTGVALVMTPTDAFDRRGDARTGSGRFLAALWRHRAVLAQVLTTSAMLQLLGLMGPVLTAVLIDRVLPRMDIDLLWVLFGAALLLFLFQLLAEAVRGLVSLYLRTHLDVDLTVSFVDHLLSLPYAFFQTRPAGDLVLRMNSNSAVREMLTTSTISSLLDGLLVNGYLVLLFVANQKMGLLVIALAILQVVAFLLVRRRQKELMTEGLEVEARKASYEVEMISAVETIKSLGAEDLAVAHWTSLFTDTHNVSLSRGRLDSLFVSFTTSIRQVSNVVILLFGASLVIQQELTLGSMLALNFLAAGTLGPLGNLVNAASQLQLMGSYLQRIDDVMLSEPESRSAKRDAPLGNLAVERLSFRYSRGAPLVVRDVSFEIERGQYVGIVGHSGSGKSTVAKLLLGLYEPTSGRVLVDGVDLKNLDARALRQQIGVVPQEPKLFSVSIRDNIALARPDCSLADVIAATQTAGLHDEIVAMPMGYDTLLMDRGLSLSGGQRQRLALARALIRDPIVLLLDEATSSMDAESERAVHAALEGLSCTRIAIAHRLSTVRHADKLIVMEGGTVVEQGTHDGLVKAGGRYATLIGAQLQGLRPTAEQVA